MYLVLSAFISNPVSFLVITKASVFFLLLDVFGNKYVSCEVHIHY